MLYSSFRVRLCRTATERVYRNSPFRYARRVDARGVAERGPPNGWSCGSTTSLSFTFLSPWVEPDSYFSYFHITWVISSSELRWLRERGGRGPFLFPTHPPCSIVVPLWWRLCRCVCTASSGGFVLLGFVVCGCFFPSSNNGIIIVLYSSFRVRLCRTATERVYRNSPFRYARRVDARGVAERGPPNGWSCGSTTSLSFTFLSPWVEPDSYFSYFHITWVISSSELRWLRERGGRGPFLFPWRRLSRRQRRRR